MELTKVKYKQTEVGLIPEDWNVKQLKEVVTYKNGAAHENCVVDNGDYVIVNSKFVSTEGRVKKFSNENRCPVNKDEVLMVLSDVPNGKAIAKCYYVSENNKYTLNQRICSFKSDKVDSKYLFLILNRNPYYLQFDDGVKQTNLRNEDVLSCPIPLPPKIHEQKAIATALSDVDDLITNLDKLISKKKAIKQGAMQQLLTPPHKGGKRLAGYSGEWHEKRLGDLIHDFQNGFAFSAKGYQDTGVPIVTMAQIGLEGQFQFDSSKINCWDKDELKNLKDFVLQKGDLIMSMTDVTPDKNLIGRMTIIERKGPFFLNQRVGHLRVNEELVNPIVLKHLANMREWRTYSKAIASLGVQANIGTTDIKNGVFTLPPIKEQNAIAEILSDMDAEIKQLELKKAKYHDIKEGMMQELLTGKTRLV